MRIAVDASRTVVPRRTGTERYSLELLRRLLMLGGHDYQLYFNRPPPAGLLPAGLPYRQRAVPFPRLWTHLRLAAELARERPDLLFVPAHVLPLAYRGRSVVTIHDLGFRLFPGAHPPAALLYLELSTRWAARRATRLIAVSHATAQALTRWYGVDASRIAVVHEGVSPDFGPPSAAALQAARERYRLGQQPYLLSVGTLQPRKNLDGLLRAFRLLLERIGPGYSLVIAGGSGWGGGRARLVAEAARLGLTDRVRFVGYVPDEDLPALYGGALAYVQPSLYEGFGLPVLEALACGAPVVAAASSALPELVGPTGLLVDPRRPESIATALEQLVREPERRAALAGAGPTRAAQFSWERCARETLAVLEAAGSS